MDLLKFLQGLFGTQNTNANQPIPTPTPDPFIAKGWTKTGPNSYYKSDLSQQLTNPLPVTNTVPIPANSNYRFAYENLPRDINYSQTGPRPNFQPSQPPADIGALIREFFPNEATAAAAVLSSENATFNPNLSNVNANGTIDLGVPQINENTFNGLMQRQGNYLRKMGINSFEDMRDLRKSFIVASLIHEGSKQANPKTAGWGPWFGWQDTGFDVNNGYYSQPSRQSYELKKRGR